MGAHLTQVHQSTKPAPVTWVESLFARMTACYGNKFLDMWRGADMVLVKHLWADEMGKLTNEELKRGYAALMTRDWPPSLPEYVKMCRPPVDELTSYYEAVNGCHARDRGEMGNWSHPAIYWAAVKMAFDIKGLTYSGIKDRWNKALHDEMEKGEWAAIPQPMKALPEPGKSELSRDKAKKLVQELGASKVLERKPGSLDWAHKIIDRSKRGDKTLTGCVVRMAREALEGVPA
jgi:hypothetical protein